MNWKRDLLLILLGMLLSLVMAVGYWQHKRITNLENFANQLIVSSQRQKQQPQLPSE